MRRFEKVSKYQDIDLKAPKRSTRLAAGYDFYAAEDTVIPSLWKAIGPSGQVTDPSFLKSTLVPLGYKAQMPADEFLMLVNRSSSPMKFQLALPNGVGIIDADYYDNPNNEGEIFLQLINYGPEDHLVRRGDRICQGIFQKYGRIEDESDDGAERSGGFGSSGTN